MNPCPDNPLANLVHRATPAVGEFCLRIELAYQFCLGHIQLLGFNFWFLSHHDGTTGGSRFTRSCCDLSCDW